MEINKNSDFGPFRSIFWPIHRREIKLVIPMLIILFLTCFNYSILRNLKDVLVVTAPSSGGEVIPFIKVWAMLPMAVLSAFIFTKLTNHFSQEKVYYLIVTGFLLFYFVFGFVIYPYRDSLVLNSFADFLETVLPIGLKGFVSMIRYWTFTLFYVMCELWGSIVLTVLFWGFANEVTKVRDARRYYSLLGVVSSISAIIAGFIGMTFSRIEYIPSLPFGRTAWEQTIMGVVIVVTVVGIGIICTFRWMNKHVLNSPKYDDLHSGLRKIKMKKKQSLRDSFSYLYKSKYLVYIAVLVVGYNLSMNLVEVVWKDQLKQLYPNKSDYFVYLSYVTVLIGVFSSAGSFLVGRIIGAIGWTRTALITPIVILFTSLGFFGFIIFNYYFGHESLLFMGMSPLFIAVLFGSAQNCFSKAGKYSVFDATKEMAFIPLDHESKLKGKAAIDGVGSRIGKSGGSLAHQGLLMFCSNFMVSAPYVAGILVAVIGAWIAACRLLGIEFANLALRKRDITEGVTDQLEEEAVPAAT